MTRSRVHCCAMFRTAWAAILFVAAVATAMPAAAQLQVNLVEEHWELRIGEPDSDVSAPQMNMVMSPTADSDGVFFLFNINHRSAPGYEPGGMQVQLWDNTDLLEFSTGNESGALAYSEEVVSWVQRLELQDGQLTFGIHDGSSETWGSFGGSDLELSTPTTLTGLNAYRPAVSLTESQVGYAENRVVSLVLTKLVWKTSDGETHVQTAPIRLDTSLDP